MVLAAFGPFAHAQTGRVTETNAAGWYMYSGDHPIAGRWGVHLEPQVRRNDVITEWERIQFRVGLNYGITRSVTLTAGYVYIRLFPTGRFSPSVPEQRAYEQALIAQNAGRWKLGHRVRLEQVWKGALSSGPNPVFTGYRYENRFRYEIRPRRRLSANYYLQFAAEQQVRFGFTGHGRALFQFRAYSALGRRLSRFWDLESGYMLQYVIPQTGPIYQLNHVLRISVLSTAPF